MDEQFKIPPLLEECNSFERELLLEVFQNDYAESLKTRDLISHIDLRAEELGIRDDERISSALSKLSDFERFHRGLIRGSNGEYRAYRSVKHAMAEKRILLNLEVNCEGEHNEFDQVVITPGGIALVEVKNYSHDALIGADGILRDQSNGRSVLYNVGERMSAKASAISKVLQEGLGVGPSECPVFCVLLNANERSFIKDAFGKVKVCSTGSIPYYIEGLGNGGDLSLGRMDEIAAFLRGVHEPVDIEPSVDCSEVYESLEAAIALIEETSASFGCDCERPEATVDGPADRPSEPTNLPRIGAMAAAAAVAFGALGFIGGVAFAKAA